MTASLNIFEPTHLLAFSVSIEIWGLSWPENILLALISSVGKHLKLLRALINGGFSVPFGRPCAMSITEQLTSKGSIALRAERTKAHLNLCNLSIK